MVAAAQNTNPNERRRRKALSPVTSRHGRLMIGYGSASYNPGPVVAVAEEEEEVAPYDGAREPLSHPPPDRPPP